MLVRRCFQTIIMVEQFTIGFNLFFARHAFHPKRTDHENFIQKLIKITNEEVDERVGDDISIAYEKKETEAQGQKHIH